MINDWGLYLMVFAVLYLVFTAVIVGHGIHFTNVIISAGMIVAGTYYLKK